MFRDLTILEVRVWLLHYGPCATKMTGNYWYRIKIFFLVWRWINKQCLVFLDLYCLGINILFFTYNSLIKGSYSLSCRNRLLVSLLNMCRDLQDRLPKVVGIDIVEMALWAKVCPLTIYFIQLIRMILKTLTPTIDLFYFKFGCFLSPISHFISTIFPFFLYISKLSRDGGCWYNDSWRVKMVIKFVICMCY